MLADARHLSVTPMCQKHKTPLQGSMAFNNSNGINMPHEVDLSNCHCPLDPAATSDCHEWWYFEVVYDRINPWRREE